MKRFWVSFWSKDPSKWEYHGPWWISGERGGWDDADDTEQSICAAVTAADETQAKRIIEVAHDKGHKPSEWRFVTEKAEDWEPFCDRFERREWMKWPWPDIRPAQRRERAKR